MIRYIPLFLSGATCNVLVGLLVGRISGTILLGKLQSQSQILSEKPSLILMVSPAVGSAATGCACLIFALVNPHITFWAYGLPAGILVVLGADLYVEDLAPCHDIPP